MMELIGPHSLLICVHSDKYCSILSLWVVSWNWTWHFYNVVYSDLSPFHMSPCWVVSNDMHINLTTVTFVITGFRTIVIRYFYNVFADRCRSHTFIFDDNADICYQIWSHYMTRMDANRVCNSANARLLRIPSNTTLALAQSEIASTWFLYYAWM